MRSARALQGPRDGLTATILAAYYVFYRDAMIWYILLGDSRRKDLKISYAKRFLSSCYVFGLLVFPPIINRGLVQRSHPAIGEGKLEGPLIMLNRDQQQVLVVDQKIVRKSSSQWQSSSARRGNAKLNTTGDSV